MTCATNRAEPCDCERERKRSAERAHQDLVVKFLFHLTLTNPSVASASELVKLAKCRAVLFEEAVQIYLSAE